MDDLVSNLFVVLAFLRFIYKVYVFAGTM